MGMQVGGNKGSSVAEMNVVPLIDILLVLLIIFMVITPTTPAGLKALVPQPNNQTVVGPSPNVVVVQVVAGDRLKINEESSSWENLGARLKQIFDLRADKVAFVKGEANTDFGVVARAIDIMRTAGIDKVGLLPSVGGKA